MAQLFSNNAFSTLASAVAASSTATTIALATGGGAKFPAPTSPDFFLATLIGIDANGNENAWEVVKVTANASDSLTVVRAFEGIAQQAAAPLAWAAGTRIELRDTAGTLLAFQNASGGQQTGDILYTARNPGSGYLKADGTVYAQSSYAALFGALGIVPQYGSIAAGVSQTSGFSSNSINSVCYANGLFVAVGASGKIATSPDGATWTSRTSGTTSALSSVCYGNGVFVAIGQSTLLTSPDGITWTGGTATQANNQSSIAYGNGIYVIASTSGSSVYRSTNLTSWAGYSANNNLSDVTYGSGLFVVTGSGGTYTSPDGITWTSRTGPGTTPNDIIFGNGMFVAVGQNGNLYTSPDGITWTSRTSGLGSVSLGSVCYGNGLFVVFGLSTSFSTSPDGITWTTRTGGFGTTYLSYSAAYGNGFFVAVGNTGTVLRCVGVSYDITSQFAVPTLPSYPSATPYIKT